MLHSRLRPLPRKIRAAQSQREDNNDAQAPDFSHLKGTDYEDADADEDEAEDIFSAFLPHLLPDDAPQFHGDPGQLLRYDSPLYGPLKIMVPHYPGQSDNRNAEIAAGQSTSDNHSNDNEKRKVDECIEPVNKVDEGRKLFAHFLWSAALVVAQEVEDADSIAKPDSALDKTIWSVKGHRVLELGAGAGLPSVISVLASASHVTITDHPSSPAFLGAIEYNIMENVPASLRRNIEAIPCEWGVLDNDRFAQDNKGRFTRIIAADCLWMIHQHENLVKTLLWFLSTTDCSTVSDRSDNDDLHKEGRVWVVAGFHTGRAIVAHFFERAVAMGLEIETIYERDLNAGEEAEASGKDQRAWEPVRAGEGPENRKRWCVIAVLKRAATTITTTTNT